MPCLLHGGFCNGRKKEVQHVVACSDPNPGSRSRFNFILAAQHNNGQYGPCTEIDDLERGSPMSCPRVSTPPTEHAKLPLTVACIRGRYIWTSSYDLLSLCSWWRIWTSTNRCHDLPTADCYVFKVTLHRIQPNLAIMTMRTILCALVLVLGTAAQSDDDTSGNSSLVALCNSTFLEANGVSYIQQN